MNALIRHKGGNLKPFLLQSFKRNLKPNFLTYNSLRYNYNRNALHMVSSSYSATSATSSVINTFYRDDGYSNNSSSTIMVYRRRFHTSLSLSENSSKVDSTVKNLKTKQKEKVEEIMKEVSNNAAQAAATTAADGGGDLTQHGQIAKPATKAPVPVPVKKPLKERIWDEIVHYYHGFRLLFIDVTISSKLLWRVLNGKTLTRRENKQLLRTTSDLFRLIPFSVFVIVPFMELLLPLFIKFFPGMLPSTFQTDKERENRLRQSLAVRLEMAKFLQQTLDEMPLQHRDHKSEEAKQFEEFFNKVRSPDAMVNNEEIIKFAKRFDDEITLDSLSREQLAALCRVLELNTIGTTTLLRFQLRLKLRALVADDRVIAREGVNTLDLFELQQACKARGMRAYGLTAERLRFQLKEWIDLSLTEKVPPTLMLLSRAMHISDDSITTDKLKETMRVLPDSVGAQTRHAIGEREGKVDHKTKIEIIREEERKIKEEREEEKEEIKAAQSIPYVSSDQLNTDNKMLGGKLLQDQSECLQEEKQDKRISTSDVQLLSEALKTLSSDKKLVVEKETIKEIKEELADYKDDVEELYEVRQVVKEPVHESRAAKMLYNRVNKMISNLDKVLNDLEQKQEKIKKTDAGDIFTSRRSDFVHIDELVETIKRMKEASDETRFKVVEKLLFKLDNDKDGAITVNEIMKVVKSMDTNKIDQKQLDEFMTLLKKQAEKSQQEEIVRIDELMTNIKKLKETSNEARLNHIVSVLGKFDADKDGVVTVNELLKVLESLGRENIKLEEKQIEELITLLDKEQILHAEEKIEKAIAKSMKEAEKLKAEIEKSDKVVNKLVDDINDSAQEIKDIAKELGAVEKSDELQDVARDLKDKAKEFKKDPKLTEESPMKDAAKELKDNAKSLDNNTKPTNDPKAALGTSMQNTTLANSSTAEEVLREATERHVEKLIPKQISDLNIGTNSTLPPPTNKTMQPPKSATATAAPVAAVNGNSKKIL